MAAYGFQPPRPRRTTPVNPTRASGGRLSKRPTPQYQERESRNVADDRLRAAVLKALGASVQPQGSSKAGLMPSGTTAPMRMPQVPEEPVMGNPYAGVEAKIGKFAQASSKRQQGDIRSAKQALHGRADPGADIAGSFNAQAAGMAAELAATGTALRNQARQGYAEAELERRGKLAQNRYEARSAQIKGDAQLLNSSNAQLSPSQAAQLEEMGIDASRYLYNPMGAMVALGRSRFARRNEAKGLPPTAWAQAAQYGLGPPDSFGTSQDFYTALGQAKSGLYGGGGNDAGALLQALGAAGLLKGLPGAGG